MATPDWRAKSIEFETEVRRIAALLFPDERGGSTIYQGREHDGVFVTEDLAVAIEATTATDKAKAEQDGRKLKAICERLASRYPYKGIKGYFITQGEPTAYQHDVIRRIGQPLAALSYAAFRAHLVDVRAYIAARKDHPFGSARDPETNKPNLLDEYVALDFVDVGDRNTQYGIDDLIKAMSESARLVLLGDYGAGKSMTLREIFLRSVSTKQKRESGKFCLHLNLNEHQGQTNPAEALLRHAETIGFENPHQLVRAWKSGDAHILLDGFDELFTPGLGAITQKSPVANFRHRSVQLIRQFLVQTPAGASVVIAGRQQYFDSLAEMRVAFGLDKKTLIASATDFTEAQVQQYLDNRKWTAVLPTWLPRRPLLIGYLASRSMLDLVGPLSTIDVGAGWDGLLDSICERDAQLESGVSGASIRQIIERLATLARRTATGLGPISFEDLVLVFQELQGRAPDEAAYGVLQRLPGLRTDDTQTNSRVFVDDDYVDAARAGDVLNWVSHRFNDEFIEGFRNWQNMLGDTGMAVLSYRLATNGTYIGTLQAAAERAWNKEGLEGIGTELIRLILLWGATPTKSVPIHSQHIPSLAIGGSADASKLTLTQCIIDTLDVTDVVAFDNLPYMIDCAVGTVHGMAEIDDFASEKIRNCTFESFSDSTENISAILKLDLSDYTRIALTILRRTYGQSGRARKENAFYRGSMTPHQRELIPKVLHDLQAQGAVRRIRRRDVTLWEPNRALVARIRTILDSPTSTRDPLVIQKS
ncbi:NACHT domain-containing protein [Kribbella sp. DT2]|uniref:NACHT domain-containing protein n=1 Tax=Kribbella sp. DT2 TaxID=3393427 RepID=UPI003CE9702F